MVDRRAFTWIELIAVIAILVILATILIPVIQRTRGRSAGVTCASNLRQIGGRCCCT